MKKIQTYELPPTWPSQLMPTVGPLTDAKTSDAAAVDGPRINLYARRSPGPKEEGLESVDRQIERLLPVAEKLGYPLEHVVKDNGISAERIRFRRRPLAKPLIRGLREGDWLLITALDRLERGSYEMQKALRWLERRKIRVYVLDMFGREIDRSDDTTALLIGILALYSEWEGPMRKGRIRAAIAYMRKKGLAAGGHKRPGERRIKAHPEGTGRFIVLRRERSQPEIDLIRSIHDRVRLGNESLLGLFKKEGHTWKNAEGHRLCRQAWGSMVQWYADQLAKGRSPATEPIIYYDEQEEELKKEK